MRRLPMNPDLLRRQCLRGIAAGCAAPLLAGALLSGPGPVLAADAPVASTAPPEVAAALPGARLRGQGQLTFLTLPVYSAQLWVAPGFDPAKFNQQPLALVLGYERTLYGKLIAERSLDEMRRQREISEAQAGRWLAEMLKLFPDVNKGDRITGVQVPGEAARFFFNGQLRGELPDPDFVRLFFGIWLSERSSEPALRRSLLQPAAGAS